MGNAQTFTVHKDIKVLSDCGKNRLLCVLTASINTLNVSAAATMNQPGDLFYKVHCWEREREGLKIKVVCVQDVFAHIFT